MRNYLTSLPQKKKNPTLTLHLSVTIKLIRIQKFDNNKLAKMHSTNGW